MSKQKQIGTATEGAVARYLRDHGFPNAERRALAGIHDLGDITGTPGVAWEVKGGRAAENASDGQIELWLAETEVERSNAKADLGLLIVKRKGIGLSRAGEWWAVMDGGVFADLVYEPEDGIKPFTRTIDAPVRVHLAAAVVLLRESGYGDPL